MKRNLRFKNIKEEKNMAKEDKEMTLKDVLDKVLETRQLIEDRLAGSADNEVKYEKALETFNAKIAEIEKQLAPRTTSLPGSEDAGFMWSKAFYAIASGDWGNAGVEKEIFDNTKKRTAMEAQSGSLGGNIVPREVSADLIGMFEAQLVLAQAGVTTLNGLTGSPYDIPRQTGGATAYWVGENEDITESNLTLGTMTMTPKAVACLVKTSNRLLRLANESVENMIKRDIALRMALKADLAGLRGTGSSTQPLGVANTSGVNSVVIGDDGGNISFDVLMDMEYMLEEDNALFGKLAYVWHPCIRRNLQKLKVAQFTGDTGGQYVVQPVTRALLREWIGYDYFATTQLPTNLTKNSGINLTELVFGNWQEMIFANWGGIEIAASSETYTAFQKNQTWIRIAQDVDFAVRHPESFCVCSDANKVNA
jgi:HK97 family phage major capsid protein